MVMNRSLKHSISALLPITVGLALSGLVSTVAFANNMSPRVFPINSRPYGQTYGQWSARWWQYAVQQTTLNLCAKDNPNSRITFLAGTPGLPPVPSSCVVPAGQAIMFPVFNVEWSVAEAQAQEGMTPGQSCVLPGQPDGTTDAALQACATAQADHATFPDATLAAYIDGATLQGVTSYRAVSPPFDFTAANGNLFVIPPGSTHAVADGFWIILTPLSRGSHTIRFTATVPFPELGFTFLLDQTYHVSVGP
jgi:hypothetical protein